MTEYMIPEVAKVYFPLTLAHVVYPVFIFFLASYGIIKSRKLLVYFPFVVFSFLGFIEGIWVLHLFFLTPYWAILEIVYFVTILWMFIILWGESKK